MSSGPPPAKRKRAESELDIPEDEVERSALFWFDDGNVVLQAEATRFRVHRSVLSHHSSVMKDCFQCPQPEDAPTVEGCPLVHLQDSAKDIGNMCSLLYGMYHVDIKTITSSFLITMLLMGRKYEIASFTTLAEGILLQLFPPTLEQWDACQEEIKNITTRDHRFLFDLFNLVYEFPLPSILRPLLISMCTIFNLATIKACVSTQASPAPDAKQYCVLARMICMQLMAQKFMRRYCGADSNYAIPTRMCSSSKCLSSIREITTEVVIKSGSRSAFEFPPPADRAYATSDTGGNRLCFACYQTFQEVLDSSRHAVWEELPGTLDVLRLPQRDVET